MHNESRRVPNDQKPSLGNVRCTMPYREKFDRETRGLDIARLSVSQMRQLILILRVVNISELSKHNERVLHTSTVKK